MVVPVGDSLGVLVVFPTHEPTPANFEKCGDSVVVDVVTAVARRDEVLDAQGDSNLPWSSVDEDVLDVELDSLVDEALGKGGGLVDSPMGDVRLPASLMLPKCGRP